jgi:hypothetical protein
MKNIIIKNAILNAALTAIYIALVAWFIFYVPRSLQSPDTFLVPMIMLSLFVFSAALTGSLVFGRPVLWYLDGKKKEAVLLLVYTLTMLLIIIFAAFLLLLTL